MANPEILVEIWRLEGSRRNMALERRRRRLESSAQVCASDVCAESDRNCTGNGRSARGDDSGGSMFVPETLIAPGFAGPPPSESMYSRISAAPVLQVPDTVETLILDLLEWIGPNPRPYGEVLEAWRTSCPRLPVWEDANDRGFIRRHHAPGHGALVSVSAAGAEHLRRHRQPSPR